MGILIIGGRGNVVLPPLGLNYVTLRLSTVYKRCAVPYLPVLLKPIAFSPSTERVSRATRVLSYAYVRLRIQIESILVQWGGRKRK